MKSENKKVLVCGASIAGPTLAFWLAKYGFNVTVVERSKSLRLGGQHLDVRGAGRAITRMMDIEKDILAANTGEVGLQFVNSDNKVEAAFPADGADSFTSEAEILRGSQILNPTTNAGRGFFIVVQAKNARVAMMQVRKIESGFS